MARAYHLGKINQLFARTRQSHVADPSTQALVEMWDDGVMIVDVHPALMEDVSKGQFVLVCYDFQSPQLSTNTIIKLLDNENGEESWKRMKQFHERRKKAALAAQAENSEGFPNVRMVR